MSRSFVTNVNRRDVRVMPSFYKLSEKLARTIAELPLFCQEHLADGEAGYLASTLVVMNAFESGWAMNTMEVQLKDLERESENKTWKFFYH